jgi:hypothetical protein
MSACTIRRSPPSLDDNLKPRTKHSQPFGHNHCQITRQSDFLPPHRLQNRQAHFPQVSPKFNRLPSNLNESFKNHFFKTNNLTSTRMGSALGLLMHMLTVARNRIRPVGIGVKAGDNCNYDNWYDVGKCCKENNEAGDMCNEFASLCRSTWEEKWGMEEVCHFVCRETGLSFCPKEDLDPEKPGIKLSGAWIGVIVAFSYCISMGIGFAIWGICIRRKYKELVAGEPEA